MMGGKATTTSSYITKAKLKHGRVYDYSEVDYSHSQGKVSIICKIHGQFDQMAYVHLTGKGCPTCAILRRTKTKRAFIIESKLKHGKAYVYNEVVYINAKTKVRIKCKKHGVFIQTPDNHVRGNGCPSCS